MPLALLVLYRRERRVGHIGRRESAQ